MDIEEVAVLKEKIGFVGGKSYDIILLFARTLTCFGEKVLIADRNIFHTLASAIPVPEGLQPGKQIVSYDGIFYTESERNEEELTGYDFVLYDFGMVMHRELMQCSMVYVVSGCLPHHIQQLRNLCLPKNKVRGIIFRDLLKKGQKDGTEIKELLSEYPECRTRFLKQEYLDQKNCFVYETTHEYRLRDASEQMQELIYTIFSDVYTEVEEKSFWKRIRKLERKGYL